MNVWDKAGIKLTSPGLAIRLATYYAMRPEEPTVWKIQISLGIS